METKMTFRFFMVLVCALLCTVGLVTADTVVIANSGQPVPEGNGLYATFTDPVLNAFQRLAFRSDLTGTSGGTEDDRAIYRADAAGATLICREDWWTPNANGRFFALSTPAMNNASQVVFRGDADGTTLGVYDFVGIYRSAGPGALDQIVRGNDPAPDGNGQFFIMSETPLIDDYAVTTFWASFTGTSSSYNDDTAVVMDWLGAPRILAREGQTVPGGDGQFSSFLDISENENQGVAFNASLTNTSAGNDNDTGIFRAQPGFPATCTQLVRENQAPPDGNGQYSSLHLGPIFNDLGDGRASFLGWMRNTSGGVNDDVGIFLATTSGVIRIARDGQTPPDGNGQYTVFNSNTTQNNTRVAFVATMRNTAGGTADSVGLYWGNGLSTHKIVRGGDAAPDGNGAFWGITDPIMNKYGHVAFRSQFTGTAGGSSDNWGLYIGDGYDIVQVARTGDPLLGSTITELSMADGANCRNGFNRYAQVAYRAVLADGRQAMVLFTPEINWKGGSGGWYAEANWTLSIMPDAIYDVTIAPIGGAHVIGPRANTIVKSLTVGNTSGNLSTLNLNGEGDVAVVNTCTVMPTGTVEIGPGRTLAAADIVNQGELNIMNGGLVSVTGTLTIDSNANGDGFVCMGGGGMLGLYGDADDSLVVFLRLIDGTDAICYWDDAALNWADITAATYGDDYTLSYLTEGDLAGYTMLTVDAPTPVLLEGDANNDGVVSAGDYASVQANFGNTGPIGILGDANMDGVVSAGDYASVQANFGNTSTPQVTPEPATMSLLVLGGIAMLKRRRN
jgi:hypothetical protein